MPVLRRTPFLRLAVVGAAAAGTLTVADVPGIGARRGVPDVASDADLDTGIACVEAGGGQFVIAPGGGTSAGAPAWAGIVALADQYAGRHLGLINPAICKIGRSAEHHRAFHMRPFRIPGVGFLSRSGSRWAAGLAGRGFGPRPRAS
jgi:hypothetical protein